MKLKRSLSNHTHVCAIMAFWLLLMWFLVQVGATWVRSPAVRALDPAVEGTTVHLCLFSDRELGLTATLASAALNSKHAILHAWVVTDNASAVSAASNRLGVMGLSTRLRVHPLALSAVVAQLLADGHRPVWTWPQYNSSVRNDHGGWDTAWARTTTAHPGSWDASPMHAHPLNHLRFYIPYIRELQSLDRVLFVDDDLVIQGDVAHAWRAKDVVPAGRALVGACEIWGYDKDNAAFRHRGSHSNYAHSSALPQVGRAMPDTLCSAHSASSHACVGSKFWPNLFAQAKMIGGGGQQLDLEEEIEWNFGFTLLDLETWRRVGLTRTYEAWMRANYEWHIFPETSLMYGLGIAFLAFSGRVACWSHLEMQPPFHVRDGLGYVAFVELQFSGINPADFVLAADVLHYDGWRKPWAVAGSGPDPVFSLPFRETLKGRAASEYASELVHAVMTEPMKKADDWAPFVLFSEPGSGAEALMRALDAAPRVCSSGAFDGLGRRIGFPLHVLAPRDRSPRFFDRRTPALRMPCYAGFLREWVPRVQRNYNELCGSDTVEPVVLTSLNVSRVRPHVPRLCAWVRALGGHVSGSAPLSQSQLVSEYLSRLLNGDDTLWPCRCPHDTRHFGIFFNTDWVGAQFNLGENYDSGDSAPSMWAALQATRPRVVWLTRTNPVEQILERRKLFSPGQGSEAFLDAVAQHGHEIAAEVEARERQRAYIAARLEGSGVVPLRLSSERCSSDAEECVAAVVHFLKA